eukprot:TRINITY_DN11127_c0_g1_i1.p1 TRINITY_DN11127_c0_g1~~TRINITY_DN11127_c0_g1_i1.p1  ORF type:complete len:198 (-),score=4.88 TRINITY_DN11127_c0_g1_i1:10-603(-)
MCIRDRIFTLRLGDPSIRYTLVLSLRYDEKYFLGLGSRAVNYLDPNVKHIPGGKLYNFLWDIDFGSKGYKPESIYHLFLCYLEFCIYSTNLEPLQVLCEEFVTEIMRRRPICHQDVTEGIFSCLRAIIREVQNKGLISSPLILSALVLISSFYPGAFRRYVSDTTVFLMNEVYHFRCLLYTSPSPRDRQKTRMPSSA